MFVSLILCFVIGYNFQKDFRSALRMNGHKAQGKTLNLRGFFCPSPFAP